MNLSEIFAQTHLSPNNLDAINTEAEEAFSNEDWVPTTIATAVGLFANTLPLTSTMRPVKFEDPGLKLIAKLSNYLRENPELDAQIKEAIGGIPSGPSTNSSD